MRRASETARSAGWRLFLALGLHRVEQLAQRLPHDPRDLHLRDAQPPPDLVLVEVLLEPKAKDRALPIGERRTLRRDLSLDLVVSSLGLADGLHHRHGLRVLPAARDVERQRATRLLRLERLGDLLYGELQSLGDLGDRGGFAVLLRELLRRLLHGHRPLLEATREPKLPDAIAEVPAKLAEDRRGRIGDERASALQIEPVEGLHEP